MPDGATPLRALPSRLLAVLALALAVLALASYTSDLGGRRQLQQLASEALPATARTETLNRIRREGDPERARLILARALVAEAMTPGPAAAEVDLELARRLAGEVEEALPGAWEAPMLRGAATYLEWSRDRDDRLVLEADSWQQPLLDSLALGPGETEPDRFLAAAYLELWPALSHERQLQARGHIRRALADRATFYRLVRPWLERAENRRIAFDAIPDAPFAWAEVRDVYAQRRDWRAWGLAHEAWTRSLLSQLQNQLAEADQRLHGGDLRGARELYVQVVHGAPATPAGTRLLEEALSRCPPSVANRIYLAGLRKQLDRALDLALLGRPLLPPPAVARLAQAAGELEPPVAALTAVESGDLPRGALLERRNERDLWNETWSPYLTAKAEALLARGEVAEAGQALAQVHPEWHRRLPYWRARLGHARAAGERVAEEVAEVRLAAFATMERPASDWRREGNVSRLDLAPETPVRGLALSFVQVPPAGVVVEVRVDGMVVDTRALRPGGQVEIASALAPGGDHLIEVEPLTGGTVAPGTLRLLAER